MGKRRMSDVEFFELYMEVFHKNMEDPKIKAEFDKAKSICIDMGKIRRIPDYEKAYKELVRNMKDLIILSHFGSTKEVKTILSHIVRYVNSSIDKYYLSDKKLEE